VRKKGVQKKNGLNFAMASTQDFKETEKIE